MLYPLGKSPGRDAPEVSGLLTHKKSRRCHPMESSGEPESNSVASASLLSLEKFRYRNQACADDKGLSHTVRNCPNLICHDLKIVHVEDRKANDNYDRNAD
jgi:hypothetical protein